MKTLNDIRSEACNAILITFAVLAVPAVGTSLLRGVEQGWRPVMGVHVLLLLLLAWTALRRNSLGLFFRALTVTAVPFIVAVGGLLTYGRGNGVLMFFVSSCVLAGCFFGRRAALAVAGLSLLALAVIYAAYRWWGFPLPLNPSSYDMTVISWIALGGSFIAASVAPVIGLSALVQSLDAERRRADEAVKVRSNFLASMSHELRTPMAGIIGMSEALRATSLDAEQQGIVDNLMRSGRTLLAMLNDVLDFSMFETGRISVRRAPFRLSELFRDVGAVFETAAARKGLAFKMELPSRFDDAVVGDGFRIGQILSNLINNAIKFTARGSVVVRAGLAPRDDGRLLLTCTVADTGIGIDEAQAARIFEPFIQADMSTARTHGGSGLGLAICRSLADALGGTVTVASHPGRGSTFTLNVPLERHDPAAADGAPGAGPSGAPRPAPAGRSLRVLVADDDPSMRILADIMLARRGHRLTIVEDGESALAAAAGGGYDCIILDMHMPVMDGCAVMAALKGSRGRDGAAHAPVIALTADVVPAHISAFLDAGADAVAAKPVEWDALEAKMQELAGREAP